MMKLLVTFADRDSLITRFNGTMAEAVDHYSLNNRLLGDETARVSSIRFIGTNIEYEFQEVSSV